jgi:hypothetical protein
MTPDELTSQTTKHPGWYYNLLKHPKCELFANGRNDSSGSFVAHPTEGADTFAIGARKGDEPTDWAMTCTMTPE